MSETHSTVLPKREQSKRLLKEEGKPKLLEEYVPPEGGWGWVVCVASLCANGTIFGMINSYGLLIDPLQQKYKDSAFKTALVGSICSGMTFLFSIVAGILADRFGIRKTALLGGALAVLGMLSSSFVNSIDALCGTYGVLLGIGYSLAYSPSLVILGHYFKRRMGLVNGLVTAGSAVFTIVLPIVITTMLKNPKDTSASTSEDSLNSTSQIPSTLDPISNFTSNATATLQEPAIQQTFQILTGVTAILLVCSFIYKPRIPVKQKQQQESDANQCYAFTKKFLNVSIWRNRAFVVWFIAVPVGLLGYFVPFVFLPKYAKVTIGGGGQYLVTILGGTSGLGRLLFGKIADLKGVNRIILQQIAFVALGGLAVVIPFAKSFAALAVIASIMGIFDGCFICMLGPIAYDIVGPEGASQALGFLLGCCALPITLGPPLAGWILDTTGSLNWAFHLAGIPPFIGAALMIIIYRMRRLPQAYPAVSEMQEFAAVSVDNIFSLVHREGDEKKDPNQRGLWGEMRERDGSVNNSGSEEGSQSEYYDDDDGGAEGNEEQISSDLSQDLERLKSA